VGGGSGTVGLTKTVLEVEGISEGGPTYPRLQAYQLDSSGLIACESASHRCLSQIVAVSLVASPLAPVFCSAMNSS
jgi:hypothetical protein